MPFSQNHKERQEDEVFIGNVKVGKGTGVAWETARLGVNAYNAYGASLSGRYVPVFVKKEELQAKNPNLLERFEMVDVSK
jgi:hypothetical protein